MYSIYLLASVLFWSLVSSAPSAQSASCGVKGYDKSVQAYDTNSSANNYAACSALCVAESRCISFAFGSDGCYIYSVTIESNVDRNSGSPYTFYDKTCVSSVSSSSISSRQSTASLSQHSTASSSPLQSTISSTISSSAQQSTSSSSSTVPGSGTCGVTGYEKGTPASFFYSNNKADSTLTACGTLCKTTKGCVSFAFGSGDCLLYSAPVINNIDASPESPYTFYDVTCVAASSNSVSSASTAFSSSISSLTPSTFTTSSLALSKAPSSVPVSPSYKPTSSVTQFSSVRSSAVPPTSSSTPATSPTPVPTTAGNLIANGDFETGNLDSWQQQISINPADQDAYNALNSSGIAVESCGGDCISGSYDVHFAFSPNTPKNKFFYIYQAPALTPGANYSLTASAKGSAGVLTAYGGPSSNLDMALAYWGYLTFRSSIWQQQQYNFTAVGNEVIVFRASNTGNIDFYLDKISLVQI